MANFSTDWNQRVSINGPNVLSCQLSWKKFSFFLFLCKFSAIYDLPRSRQTWRNINLNILNPTRISIPGAEQGPQKQVTTGQGGNRSIRRIEKQDCNLWLASLLALGKTRLLLLRRLYGTCLVRNTSAINANCVLQWLRYNYSVSPCRTSEFVDARPPPRYPSQYSIEKKPVSDDQDSLDDYGEGNRLNDDGSFIGQYGEEKRRDSDSEDVEDDPNASMFIWEPGWLK